MTVKSERKIDRCPQCGGKAYVQGTADKKGRTKYRYRVCNQCGYRYKTQFTEIFCPNFPNTENRAK